MTNIIDEAPELLLPVVAVALVDADGRVLLQQRPPGKALTGLWEFPGGKIEAGETPEMALIRELHEELGISVKASCLAPATFASAPLGEGIAWEVRQATLRTNNTGTACKGITCGGR